VLETVRKEEEKKPKRLGWVQPNLSSVWHTGLSGAPGKSPVKWPLSGKVERRTTIIHRTVRWCSGLSGGAPDCLVSQRSPEQRSAAQSTGDAWPAPTVGRGTGLFGAPTGPELQRSSAPKKEGDRHRIIYSDCPVAHRTVRCATRQKARMAFLVCLQRLLAALGL
jgi:hypothetical protein